MEFRHHHLLARLLARRREQIRAGAGFWQDSDAADEAREARERMKNEVGRSRGDDARRQ